MQRLKINAFYTAPTAIRLLIRYDKEFVKKYDLSSLKILGSGIVSFIQKNGIFEKFSKSSLNVCTDLTVDEQIKSFISFPK